MTPTDTPGPASKESFSLDFDLQHAPAKVWRALTTPELLEQWLLPVIGHELEIGAAFTFKTQAYPGWDGTVSCRYLAIEPQRTLRMTWDVPFLQTVVTFTLTPTAAGTRLTVEQSGFGPDQKQEFGGARYGWTMMGERLVDLLARVA
jgi:uncharacterized protein YndB with AHSA1/START domain